MDQLLHLGHGVLGQRHANGVLKGVAKSAGFNANPMGICSKQSKLRLAKRAGGTTIYLATFHLLWSVTGSSLTHAASVRKVSKCK